MPGSSFAVTTVHDTFLTDWRVKKQEQKKKKQAWISCFPVTLRIPQQTSLKAGTSASSAVQFALHYQ